MDAESEKNIVMEEEPPKEQEIEDVITIYFTVRKPTTIVNNWSQ